MGRKKAVNSRPVALCEEDLAVLSGITGGGGGGGAGSDRELVVTTYRVTTAFSGASIGDIVTSTQIIDVTSTPTSVGTVWRNQTTDTDLSSVPSSANLELASTQNITKGSGLVDANTQRVVLASDGPAVTTLTSINNKTPALIQGRSASNVTGFNNTFRESFVAFPGTQWATPVVSSGDIIGIDGNSAGASYLVISKDPTNANGLDSIVESTATFSMPIEVAAGLHLSQRTVGQEMVIEVVSTETPTIAPSELTIASIQQTASVLTVTTTAPHQLTVGNRIGIYGVLADSRLNYSALVVATTPSTTQFTCTAGPMGTIPSLTLGPIAQGFVYLRSTMAQSPNGTSMIFENATTTQASFYTKSDNGDPMVLGGTLNGNHSSSIATTAGFQPIVAAGNYNFRPSSEFRLAQMSDRLQWHDVGVDSLAQTTNRATVSQVIPSNNQTYKIRFRARNNKGLTVPVAKIVSASKTGTTTVTVTTDVNHGLTTGDFVNIYGARDFVNFPNLTTATVVASIVNATSFTIVWGGAVTATTFGGFVSRVNGGQVQQGVITQTIQTETVVNSILTLGGSASWTGLLIGDYVNVHGCRDATTGADMGFDAVYRVRDIQTTNLILEQISGAPIATNSALSNCGGAVIKRTDMRLSFIRLFDFNRLRIETLNRPVGDIAGSMPVQVSNVPSVQVSNVPAVTVNSGTMTTVTTVGSITAANLNIPNIITDVVSAALTATATTAAFTPTFGSEYEINIPVTAVTGTTPTMDVVVQESDDSGTNWYDVYHFPRITAVGMYRSPKLILKGTRVRYVQTVTGTTPSFTRAINRLQGSASLPRVQRRIFDRVVSLITSNATTTTAAGQPLNIQECSNVQLVINIGTATTPPALQLEGSDDNGVSWYAIGAPLTAVASSTVQLTVNNINAELVRARVSTIGATVISGYVEIKAW